VFIPESYIYTRLHLVDFNVNQKIGLVSRTFVRKRGKEFEDCRRDQDSAVWKGNLFHHPSGLINVAVCRLFRRFIPTRSIVYGPGSSANRAARMFDFFFYFSSTSFLAPPIFAVLISCSGSLLRTCAAHIHNKEPWSRARHETWNCKSCDMAV
jgi:hypothetical protein